MSQQFVKLKTDTHFQHFPRILTRQLKKTNEQTFDKYSYKIIKMASSNLQDFPRFFPIYTCIMLLT